MQHHAWHCKRLRAEKRFRFYGQLALGLAVAILVILVGSIVLRGYPGFTQTQVRLPIAFDPAILEILPGGDAADVPVSSYQRLVHKSLQAMFPAVSDHRELRSIYSLVSANAGSVIKPVLVKEPQLLLKTADIWLPLRAMPIYMSKAV